MKSIVRKEDGFTLIELIMVIIILGILAGVAVPKLGGLFENARINTTKKKMMTIKVALVGDASATSGGVATDKGYVNDVGYPPVQLADLITKPEADPTWNRYLTLGWNGPYFSDDGTGSYMLDGWENAFIYSAANRTITSMGSDGASGGGDDIVLEF